jgi:SAM-dependent methyltransferase
VRDLTKTFDYARLIAEEKAHFSEIVVTENLKEGGVHANSAWSYYWQRVGDVIGKSGFSNLAEYLCKTFPDLDRPLEILSLASGYCGHEIDIARQMTRPYKLTCTDLIEPIFERARAVAKTDNLAINFEAVDLNFITIEPQRYDLILANAAIHHVINLEHLFEQIKRGLSPMGILFLCEVVGKNRKLIWDENERYANALLDLIPERVTRGIRIAIPEDLGGMEGIRQVDILPLLREHFSAVFEYRHGAFIRFICTHGELGPVFDPQNSETRRYLDFLINSDNCCVRNGILRPLEIWGVYKPLVRDSQPMRTRWGFCHRICAK